MISIWKMISTTQSVSRLARENQGVSCAIRRVQTHDDLVSALKLGGIDFRILRIRPLPRRLTVLT
jgi:hypothetical protein